MQEISGIVAPLLASVCVSLVALSGVFVQYLPAPILNMTVPYLVALAVGVLMGDAFIHLIPDAIARTAQPGTVGLTTVLAIFGFFLLEKLLRWRHDHSDVLGQEPAPYAKMNLLGDAVHNFVDGILIAGSFAVDTQLGVTTTLAIIVHEVPQELGDVGALIAGGYRPAVAVRLNFYCALTVILGVLATLGFERLAAASLAWLLPVAAGSFIYIAACDFIPYLHASDRRSNNWAQALGFALGIAAMQGAVFLEDIERTWLMQHY